MLSLENKRGVILYLPLRSPWELHRSRKRHRMKLFAISCLIASAIILGFLLVGG